MAHEPTGTHDGHDDFDESEEQGEQFISADDILAEVGDDGDHPMDEDDDEDGDALGELGAGPSATDNSVQHFGEHRGSVFAVSGHPTEPLAASGGEDDLGYIWDITDGEVIVKLTGHTDSVTCTAWSADGEMISTGGMDGKIRIWRRVGKENYRTWEFLTELQGPDEVMVCFCYVLEVVLVYLIFSQFLRWHPKGNVLLAGSKDSTVWLWQRLSHFANCALKIIT
jgi:ribosome assembly protein SQT1